ncbi:hypothetical protein N752_29995 [Desulforamulus aquiferis]|nr:hypothetical protein N752_29995 [Desulforamulus aquiferis]
MLTKIKAFVFTSLCTIMAAVAYLNVDINCFGLIYEPEIPKSLKK